MSTVYFQDLKANVFAIDFATGEVKWKKMYDAKNVAGPNGPAVGWGKVFVAKGKFTIAALDKESGEELWANKISDVETTGIDIQPSRSNHCSERPRVDGHLRRKDSRL